jgi:hypothetical protein
MRSVPGFTHLPLRGCVDCKRCPYPKKWCKVTGGEGEGFFSPDFLEYRKVRCNPCHFKWEKRERERSSTPPPVTKKPKLMSHSSQVSTASLSPASKLKSNCAGAPSSPTSRRFEDGASSSDDDVVFIKVTPAPVGATKKSSSDAPRKNPLQRKWVAVSEPGREDDEGEFYAYQETLHPLGTEELLQRAENMQLFRRNHYKQKLQECKAAEAAKKKAFDATRQNMRDIEMYRKQLEEGEKGEKCEKAISSVSLCTCLHSSCSLLICALLVMLL